MEPGLMNATFHRPAALVAALAVLLLSTDAIARPKTDVIHLVNGDRITGEIIELAHGELTVKTNSFGTVEIEWPDVARIDSPHTFSVETNANVRYFGNIREAPVPGRILVTTDTDYVVLKVGDVAQLGQIEPRFIDRLNGSISLGFDQTKSSETSTLTAGFDIEYQSEKVNRSLDGSYTANKTPEEGTFTQYQIKNINQFLRPSDRFWLSLASFESNEEQGIDAGAARRRGRQVPFPDPGFGAFDVRGSGVHAGMGVAVVRRPAELGRRARPDVESLPFQGPGDDSDVRPAHTAQSHREGPLSRRGRHLAELRNRQ
jgi:hypothetical protein